MADLPNRGPERFIYSVFTKDTLDEKGQARDTSTHVTFNTLKLDKDLPSRGPERHSEPQLRQHIKVFEKLNMSQVELIHPSQIEWMSPISLFNKTRMEIQ